MIAQRLSLLRPDEAAAALVLTEAGSTPERVAELLGVPVDVVTRSLRMRLGPAAPPSQGRIVREGSS